MKRFEIYKAYIPKFSQTESTVIILGNSFVDNEESVICAPITSKKVNGDNHIEAAMKEKGIIYIIAEQITNVKKDSMLGRIGELTEECREDVSNKIVELMKIS